MNDLNKTAWRFSEINNIDKSSLIQQCIENLEISDDCDIAYLLPMKVCTVTPLMYMKDCLSMDRVVSPLVPL